MQWPNNGAFKVYEMLTKDQEDRFRICLFKTRYKILIGHGLSEDERFFQAIYDTSDEKLNPDEYPEIVEEWLSRFYGRKSRAAIRPDNIILTDSPD